MSTSLSKPLAVLLIDDDIDMHSIFRAVADREHFVLQTALSAEEAMNLLDSFIPDVIVIDLFMEGMDGYQTIDILRQNDINSQCRFVATTAYYSSNTASRVILHGFDAYLQKPLDVKALGNILRSIAVQA